MPPDPEAVAARREEIRERSRRALRWSGVAQVVAQAVWALSGLVLVGLLDPGERGLAVMAEVVFGLVALVNVLGFDARVVQQDQVTPPQLSTAFWTSAAAGVAGTALAAAAAPLGARYYGEPQLAGFIIALAPVFLIQGLTAVPQALLTRELRFERVAACNIAGAVTAVGASVAIIVLGGGVWGIVIGKLVGAAVRGGLAYPLAGFRPTWVFDRAQLRAQLAFGLPVTFAQVLSYLQLNLDYLVVGRTLGKEELGHYGLAFYLVTIPFTYITQVVTRVLYPTYARLQRDPEGLREAYLSTGRQLAIATFPILCLLAACPDDAILFFFRRADALPAAPLVRVLAIMGLVRAVSPVVSNVWYATARMRFLMVWTTSTLALMAAAMAVGVRWGTAGVAWGWVVVAGGCFVVAEALTSPMLGLRRGAFFRALAPAAAIAAAVLVAALAASRALPAEAGVNARFLVPAAAGLVAWAVALRLVAPELFQRIINFRFRPSAAQVTKRPQDD